MIRPPCKDLDGTDCPNRAVGCQGDCAKYAEFRSRLDAAKKTEAEQKLGGAYAANYARRAYRHTKEKSLSPSQRRLRGQW